MLFCFALATASVNAESWDLQEEDVYGEPRLLDSVFNNTSIDMNSILALILIGVLFLVTSGGSFLGGTGYSRNSYQQQGYYDYNDYYNQDQFYKRAGGVDGEFFFISFYFTTRTILTQENYSYQGSYHQNEFIVK